MEYPLVSIVIPCYNVSEYILECLKSVEKQQYNNYEVIIVDDGSTDDTAEKIQLFISDKERFKLIKKENGGVSSARNLGITESTGDWIAFIDSDDYILENYLSAMIEGLNNYPADFCMTGFSKFFESSKELKSSVKTKFSYGLLNETIDSIFFPSPFARLYSMKIIKENDLKFDERIICGEDRAFNFNYLCYVNNCLILDNQAYVYRIRLVGSITHSNIKPFQKKYLYQYAKKFWLSFKDQSYVKKLFARNHHFAHNVLDSLLADLINFVLDNDKKNYIELVNEPISQYIFQNYRFKDASLKEKLLVFMLRHKNFNITKFIIKLYYDEKYNKLFNKFVN